MPQVTRRHPRDQRFITTGAAANKAKYPGSGQWKLMRSTSVKKPSRKIISVETLPINAK